MQTKSRSSLCFSCLWVWTQKSSRCVYISVWLSLNESVFFLLRPLVSLCARIRTSFQAKEIRDLTIDFAIIKGRRSGPFYSSFPCISQPFSPSFPQILYSSRDWESFSSKNLTYLFSFCQSICESLPFFIPFSRFCFCASREFTDEFRISERFSS